MWDLKDHTARRRTWEQAFTSKALAEFQPNVDALLEDVVGHFDQAAENKTPVDMALWSNLYSFDGQFECPDNYQRLRDLTGCIYLYICIFSHVVAGVWRAFQHGFDWQGTLCHAHALCSDACDLPSR
jgi:hypothetical protein